MTEKKKTGFEALAKTSLLTQEQSLEVRKRRHAFFIGLPREISLQENRISLIEKSIFFAMVTCLVLRIISNYISIHRLFRFA